MLKFLFPLLLAQSAIAELKPEDPFEYHEIAFYPDRWIEHKVTAPMLPWVGEEIVLITPDNQQDATAVTSLVKQLDAGWSLYRELIGQKPRDLKVYAGKPIIAGMPAGNLTCGYGCGYIGATGIEMTNMDKHLAGVGKDPLNVPHAYFYEMGRNYFVFGDRHACFTTGFAVFMRYVCTDTLKLNDGDKRTRQIINEAIDRFEKNDMSFLEAMTNEDAQGEKGDRLKDENGNRISPTDQPVMVASLMLHLREKFGGNDFVKTFYHEMLTCPSIPAVDLETAKQQCLSWLVCASVAAKTDLTGDFTKKWKLALDEKTITALNKIDWKTAKAAEVLKSLK